MLSRKTKVCIDCKRRKNLEEFPNQSNLQKSRRHYSSDGKRTECKKCHQKKNRKKLLEKPIEERRKYIREYMREYHKRSS